MNLELMVKAYIAAALWSTSLDGLEAMDNRYSTDDLSPEAKQRMSEDCERFWQENAADLAVVGEAGAGHDFWLTRNRHGAGFWDRGLGELGERLTKAAHAVGGCDLYVGDDGKLHLQVG